MADHNTPTDDRDHGVADANAPSPMSSLDHEVQTRAKRVAVGVFVFLLVLGAVLLVIHVCRPAGKDTPPPLPDLTSLASPEFPINHGTALVLVLAMDCDHCIQAAQQAASFDAKAHGLDVYCLLYGKPEDVDTFFAEIGARFPYRLATDQEYADFAGDDPPAVYLLRDGKTQTVWISYRFNLHVLRAELSQGQ